MENNIEKLQVAGNKQVVDMDENCQKDKTKLTNKSPLTPYQKYKLSKNQNGKKYFEFYNDIKVYTHNIYDW